MKPHDYRTDTGTGGLPRGRQRDRTGAIAHEDPPADHHIEEVLAALNAVRAAKSPVLAMIGTAD